MMGRLEAGQERLFYHFRLDGQVPANHLLRKPDALLDLDMVRKQLEPFYSEIGSSGTAPPAWSAGSRATSTRMPATMPRR